MATKIKLGNTEKKIRTPKKKTALSPPEKKPVEDYRCFCCGKIRTSNNFYTANDSPVYRTGYSPLCRECARKLVERTDENGESHGMTRESLIAVLRILDKPFIQEKFDMAMADMHSGAIAANSPFACYMKSISVGLNVNKKIFEDSDLYVTETTKKELGDKNGEVRRTSSLEEDEETRIARQDSIRLLGYDVFAYENEMDKPLLYGKLIKFLDASPEANEDEMKVSSIVEIVKLFNQAEKINSVIADLQSTPYSLKENLAMIKTLESTKKDIMTSALSLAKDNGISFLHNKENSKGASTYTGQMKKLNEMNLRELEVNSFDIGTCNGMQQVAQISDAAIFEQIALNENDFPEMLAEQRKLITKWKKIADKASEQARQLLRENLDLKAAMNADVKKFVSNNSVVMDTNGGVNDNELASVQFIEEVSQISDDVLNEDDGPITYDIDEESSGYKELTYEAGGDSDGESEESDSE